MELLNILSNLLRTFMWSLLEMLCLTTIFGRGFPSFPEAPVPIVVVGKDEYRAGGAANVAVNIVALGGKVTLLSPIGADYAGNILLDAIKEKGVNVKTSLIRPHVPTTVKTRVLALNQQVVRIDREKKISLTLNEEGDILGFLDAISPLPSIVVFSDYAKGTVTSTLARNIIRWGDEHRVPVIADPKPPHCRRFRGATLITPNIAEAKKLIGRGLVDQEAIEAGARELREKLSLKGVLVTQGSDGMTYASAQQTFHLPALSMEVYDVSGAGDTVVAAISLALGGDFPIEEACRFAIARYGRTKTWYLYSFFKRDPYRVLCKRHVRNGSSP